MVFYEVRMAHSAEKDLGNLSKSLVPVLWERIKALADEPRPRIVSARALPCHPERNEGPKERFFGRYAPSE